MSTSTEVEPIVSADDADSTEFHIPNAPAWVPAFLAFLRNNSNVTLAVEHCGIEYSTPYHLRKRSPEFADAWAEACEQGADRLEEAARIRAVEGTLRPVYQGGELVGHVREYSDTLLTLLLKAHKPDKFRERLTTDFAKTPAEFAREVQESLRGADDKTLKGDNYDATMDTDT